MAVSDLTLSHVSDLVSTELPQYLPPDAFIVSEITSKILTGSDDDEYIKTRVILEDGHPKLDGHTLNRFSLHISDLCIERGLDEPVIVYSNRSEIPV